MSSAEVGPDIRRFTVAVPEADLADLRDRLSRTRWPEAETVHDWSQGVPLGYLQEICHYWADGYDWRRCEAGLNAHPNHLTALNGLDIHFQHIRSPHPGATPLVITHGWPGSVVEFQKVIGPLTDPTTHGGDPDDAFHLVLPSMPGYGWSAKPEGTGTGVGAIAAMWDDLMVRLGYDSYVAQGGDWGSAVTAAMAMLDRGHCRAIHTNMPVAGRVPDFGELTPEELDAVEAYDYYRQHDSGYSKIQTTRPQTVGYGLIDSPAGLAAWILEKFWSWSDRDRLPDETFGRDELLDNISVYWFTASGASSARLYWESYDDFRAGVVTTPTGCSLFPHEIVRVSRRWAETRYTDIRYWNRVDRGGHFAALEVPDLFVAELRAAFRALR